MPIVFYFSSKKSLLVKHVLPVKVFVDSTTCVTGISIFASKKMIAIMCVYLHFVSVKNMLNKKHFFVKYQLPCWRRKRLATEKEG